MLTLDKIYHAKFVLKQVARKTDLIAATRLCPGTDLYLKTENLQVTGSFKVRGAYYKISQLSAEERAKGVIACSAGNHAQGVALAATRMGIKSVVCMPDGAPIMKVESTKRLGAEVELGWAPNRYVCLTYCGNFIYEVTEVLQSKLRIGDRFEVSGFVLGQPLTIPYILRDGFRTGAFVAGRNGGLTLLNTHSHEQV